MTNAEKKEDGVIVRRAESIYDEEKINDEAEVQPKKSWWHSAKEPGSALQIVIAAVIAISIGIGVGSSVKVPKAVTALLIIPGQLWLRALTCVACSMILAVQSLREITHGGSLLAKWVVGYYFVTTIVAILYSLLVTAFGWRRLFREVEQEELVVSPAEQALIDQRSSMQIYEIIQQTFYGFISRNIVQSFAENSLLSVLIASMVVGFLIKDRNSLILRLAREVEALIMVIISWLIKMAPIGVFFLILGNIMTLNIADIGINLGLLVVAVISTLMFHMWVNLPLIALCFRAIANPWKYWFDCSPAWITGWGTSSSAATMPVTMGQCRARGIPETITKFAIPLGTLVNMDGTAIYFPLAVQFLATTQGIMLKPTDYVIITLLATLAAIGASPIPSASLVLIVMICETVNVPVGGMYAVIIAIDWLLDRFRTMLNVSGDLFAVAIVAKMTGITDPVDENGEPIAGGPAIDPQSPMSPTAPYDLESGQAQPQVAK